MHARAILLLGPALFAGCLATVEPLPHADVPRAARDRGALVLGCPAERVTVGATARGTYLAAGCGRSLELACNEASAVAVCAPIAQAPEAFSTTCSDAAANSAARESLQAIDYADCGASGSGDVQITYRADGSIDKILVGGSYDAKVGACIGEHFSAARIAAFSGPSCTVRWGVHLDGANASTAVAVMTPIAIPALPTCASRFDKSGPHECSCAPHVDTSASVWGTGTYTDDSAVCTAAVHAGAIDASNGGVVTIAGAPGCSRYPATAAHGVSTGGWGAWSGSFYFPGHGTGTCAPPTASAADECPASFERATPDANGMVQCACSGAESGAVWGSGTYTTDSSLCTAAIHAGAVSNTGGHVQAKAAKGCGGYSGTTKHGVSTSSWGSYGSSFYFPALGAATCP